MTEKDATGVSINGSAVEAVDQDGNADNGVDLVHKPQTIASYSFGEDGFTFLDQDGETIAAEYLASELGVHINGNVATFDDPFVFDTLPVSVTADGMIVTGTDSDGTTFTLVLNAGDSYDGADHKSDNGAKDAWFAQNDLRVL